MIKTDEKLSAAMIVSASPCKTYVLDFDKIQTIEDIKNVLRFIEMTVTRESTFEPPYSLKEKQ